MLNPIQKPVVATKIPLLELTNGEQKFGMCVKCGKETRLHCGNCKRSCYCSKECQKEEWGNGHHYICTPNIEDMLTAKFNLEKMILDTCWLSERKTKFRHHETNEYGYTYIRNKHDVDRYFCVCCGMRFSYEGMLIDIEFSFKKDDVNVCCFRCKDCQAQKRVICQTTFCETKKCAINNKMNIIDFWLFARKNEGKYNTLPKEIALLVFEKYSSVVCCC